MMLLAAILLAIPGLLLIGWMADYIGLTGPTEDEKTRAEKSQPHRNETRPR